MDRRLSLYLDTARLVAALIVVVDHARALILPWAPAPDVLLGGDAVVIFFVLSGFVISYVTSFKETDWRAYSRARALRMYSVAPLAILVTVSADAAGQAINPAWYAAHDVALQLPISFYVPDWSWRSVLRYLTFTNETWLHHTTIGTSGPYWSLGFEVPYYILFGMIMFSANKVAKLFGAMLWFAVFGIKIAMFLPLWLVGVVAFRFLDSGKRMPGHIAKFYLVAALPLAICWKTAVEPSGETMFIWLSLSRTAYLAIYGFGLAVIFAASLVAVRSLPESRNADISVWAVAVRWLAGASFTLYLIHLPLLSLAAALRVGMPGGWVIDLAVLAVVIASSILLAELGERRKALLARAVEASGAGLRGMLANLPLIANRPR